MQAFCSSRNKTNSKLNRLLSVLPQEDLKIKLGSQLIKHFITKNQRKFLPTEISWNKIKSKQRNIFKMIACDPWEWECTVAVIVLIIFVTGIVLSCFFLWKRLCFSQEEEEQERSPLLPRRLKNVKIVNV